MREILLRGKTFDGEWVEGGSLIVENIDQAGRLNAKRECRVADLYYGIDEDGLPEYQIGLDKEVDPDTVSLFTGLYDKNGTKVFEGDILVRHGLTRDYYGVVRFGEFNCSCCNGVYGYTGTDAIDVRSLSTSPKKSVSYCPEVAGNIWDNPDLLTGKEKNQ